MPDASVGLHAHRSRRAVALLALGLLPSLGLADEAFFTAMVPAATIQEATSLTRARGSRQAAPAVDEGVGPDDHPAESWQTPALSGYGHDGVWPSPPGRPRPPAPRLAKVPGATTPMQAVGPRNGMLPSLSMAPAGRTLSIDMRHRLPHSERPWSSTPAGELPSPATDTVLGINLAPASSSAGRRRHTALRFELSRGTVVSIKPRRGRVMVTLQSQW